MVEYVKKIAEKCGFKNPVQMAVEYDIFEKSGLKSTIVVDMIEESAKAVKVKDQEGNTAWLPKSQIELMEV